MSPKESDIFKDILKNIEIMRKDLTGFAQRLDGLEGIVHGSLKFYGIDPNSGANSKSSNTTTGISGGDIEYPNAGSREEKFISAIRSINRAVKKSQLEDYIMHQEGNNSSNVLKSFYYTMQKMIAEEKIAMFKGGGDRRKKTTSNKHTYYALPEFLDNKGRLKEEYLPEESTWGSLGKEKILEMTQYKWELGE